MHAIKTNKLSSIRYYLSFLIFLSLPFSANADKEILYWDVGADYVGLTDVDTKNVKNDHPVTLSPQDVYQILAGLRLKDADKSLLDFDFLDFSSNDDEQAGDDRLFNSSELKRISPPISKALANAKPDEDVVFSITSSHEKALGSGPLSTSGRIFFNDNHLNLIIGELRVDLEQKYRKKGGYAEISEKIDSRKLKNFRLKRGSRKSESDIDYTFVTDDVHSLSPYKNKFRKDWVLIDVAAMQQKLVERQERAERKESIVEETTDIKKQTQQIDEEQEQLKQKVERMERYLEAKEKQEAVREVRPEPKQVIQKPRSVEERLTELKTLLDKGYITDEIYQQKMQDILKDL